MHAYDRRTRLQIESIEQAAQQSVTVVLRALPPLRQLSQSASKQRDRYAISVRLAFRRGAISDLMDASAVLLADLQHLFGLLAVQQSGSGQHGRTHARRIETLTKVGPILLPGCTPLGRVPAP